MDLDDPSLFTNRELSWLEFNRRVLEEARDGRVPPLERLKFLAIFSSNLDEFFMVRVGGLRQKIRHNITRSYGADLTLPRDQLAQIAARVAALTALQYHTLHDEVLPFLEREGIEILGEEGLTDADREHLRGVFGKQVFPVLTPMAIDPGHPFPHLLNKSLNLAVRLSPPGRAEPLVCVVPVPSVLSRLVDLPSEPGRYRFVPLEAAIRLHLDHLFPGVAVEHASAFRVTRDSEYEIDDDEVEDLLKAIERYVKERKRGAAVRLEVESAAPPPLVEFLTGALDLEPADVIAVPGMLDLTGLFEAYSVPGFPHLRDPQAVPVTVPQFTERGDVFTAIRAGDILLHHPYESFSHVVDFIEAAAADPQVLAIKLTLYRTSSDSPVVRALARAAEAGKQVTAVIELKARLDEERNILWSRELEKAGVHVVYGFVGLKTHCKAALVVRREGDGLMRYVHLATGNYNPQTARVYTDLGFFTADADFAEDVSALFNMLTGYSEVARWRKLVVAPSRLYEFMVEHIDAEADRAARGEPARVIAKVNGLLEVDIVKALYRASRAGVKIDLVCRGICALRPGVAGVSENIRVVSVIDRFLEHSRIYYFENGGDPKVLIGSADWMDRNLHRRVEAVFPVEDAALKQRLIDEILGLSLADTAKAWELDADGNYCRVEPPAGEEPLRSQERLLALAGARQPSP